MNLLAHAVLSPNEPLIRLGNFAADFLSRPEEQAMVGPLAAGVRLHRHIDSFTDKHPVVQRAMLRLTGFQRFANPIVDVYFDHFLVNNWPLDESVESYVWTLHAEILEHIHELPPQSQLILRRMIQDEWLLSYFDFAGLRTTFRRMEKRILHNSQRAVDMVGAVALLESHYSQFEQDFQEFWPELWQSAQEQIATG
ncbi:MAG: ACP phosphodiesterase [Armatimonadota bacterium]